MRIVSMQVDNFLSFGKANFDFEKQGLVLVEGENKDDRSAQSNGSGKSAMIDALVWCLYGTTLRGYENDEVIHRKVGEDCVVVVTLEDGGKPILVIRARRHSKLKNSLQVLRNGKDLTRSSVAETQELVEELLGCSRRTFLSSVVFGQDRAYRFSSLTDKEQKEILDEVLGVERFARACNVARGQAAVHDTQMGIIGRDLENAQTLVEATEKEATDLQKKNERYSAEHDEKVATEKERLAKAKRFLKENGDVDVDKLKATHAKALKDVTACEASVEKLTTADLKADGLLTNGKVEINRIKEHLTRHEALEGDCPTCGQAIDSKQQKTFAKDLRKKLIDLQEKHDAATNAAKEISERAVEAKQKLKDARNAVTAAQKALNDGVGLQASIATWKQRVQDCTERLAELDKETNPYAELVKRAQKRNKQHAREVEELTTDLAEEEAKHKLAQFWVAAYGARGIRSLLLDSSLPVLNDEAQKISRAVTGGSIKVTFSATSELKSGKTVDRFEVQVDNKHGAGSYQGNSAGEKAKVDLCVGLALQRLVASRSAATFNVVFLDEVFDHLDSAAHERVVDVLAEIDKESVYVVSHNEDLKAWFPASLRIVKKGGFSTVEEA